MQGGLGTGFRDCGDGAFSSIVDQAAAQAQKKEEEIEEAEEHQRHEQELLQVSDFLKGEEAFGVLDLGTGEYTNTSFEQHFKEVEESGMDSLGWALAIAFDTGYTSTRPAYGEFKVNDGYANGEHNLAQ